MPQPVSDIASNAEENIAHAAKIIGRSTHKRAVFAEIYRGKRRIKSVSYLMQQTHLDRKQVLNAGKTLLDNRLVKATKVDGEVAYEKIDFYHAHKPRILGLAESPAKLAAYPTKRNAGVAGRIVTLSLSARRARVRQISVDDIDSFSRVTKRRKVSGELGDSVSEAQFKEGMQRVIGERYKFKDWGGEVADLYTTRLRIGGRRRASAVALKGPAVKGKLTPGKMGKNGDQIQRLFETPADVFLVQYCRQIDTAVVAQMDRLAIARSLMMGQLVLYGVIDGHDSLRLVLSYPKHFQDCTAGR